jgi:uncharacterized membrane protein YgdD (TMEM256/DUF423 family)
MCRQQKFWISAGCIVMAIAVALGAFGAHGLESRIQDWYRADHVKRLANWETAVRYQVYHAFGCIVLGLVIGQLRTGKLALIAGAFFFTGLFLFCGGLYAWVVFDLKMFIVPVPIGGVAFIAGWLLLAWLVIARATDNAESCR